MIAMDPVLALLARFAIVLLFASAFRHKLADPLRFQGIVADYRLAPASASFLIARGLIALEIALVAGLLTPWTAREAALVAGLVLSAYAAAIGVNLVRGRREIECGCGGSGERLRPLLLVRNGMLVGVCLVAAMPPTDRILGAMDWLTFGVGLASLVLLWQAGSRLASLGDAAVAAEGSRA